VLDGIKFQFLRSRIPLFAWGREVWGLGVQLPRNKMKIKEPNKCRE